MFLYFRYRTSAIAIVRRTTNTRARATVLNDFGRDFVERGLGAFLETPRTSSCCVAFQRNRIRSSRTRLTTAGNAERLSENANYRNRLARKRSSTKLGRSPYFFPCLGACMGAIDRAMITGDRLFLTRLPTERVTTTTLDNANALSQVLARRLGR